MKAIVPLMTSALDRSAFEAMWASYFHYVTDRLALQSPFGARHPIYALIEIVLPTAELSPTMKLSG